MLITEHEVFARSLLLDFSVLLELFRNPWNLKPRTIQVQIQAFLVVSSLHVVSTSILQLHILQY